MAALRPGGQMSPRRGFPGMRPGLAILAAALMLALAVGCGGPGDETRHPRWQRAIRLREEGKHVAAAREWEEYLRRYPPAGTGAHFELAQLYHDYLDDPLLAVYHYRRHLELHPDSGDAETLAVFRAAAEKKYFAALAETHSADAAWRPEALRLQATEAQARTLIERLLAENRILKEQSGVRVEATDVPAVAANPVVPPPDGVVAAPPPAPSAEPPAAAAPERVFVVRDGDTLAKISREVYGSANHYQRIFEANRDRLAAPNQLQVGQALRIPPLDLPGGQ